MREKVALAAAAISTMVLSACADSSITEPVTPLPSFQVMEGTTECRGALPAGTYHNIIVPPSTLCILSNSVVTNNVKAFRSSILLMTNDHVGGNVEAHQAFQLSVQGSTVDGHIKMMDGESTPGAGVIGVSIAGGTVVKNGNIEVHNTNTAIIFIVETTVEKGSVQLMNNTTDVLLQLQFMNVGHGIMVFNNDGPSPKFVSENVVGHQVMCFHNTGAFVGGPNATPKTEGQCF
jgi:hypothetical protein